MKKLLAVLLALVMLVSLAACAGNTDKDNPSSDAPANSDNPSMKANINKKIAMIMQQGGLGDQGFNDTAYAGLMTCKEKYDLDVNAVECTDTTQGVPKVGKIFNIRVILSTKNRIRLLF